MEQTVQAFTSCYLGLGTVQLRTICGINVPGRRGRWSLKIECPQKTVSDKLLV